MKSRLIILFVILLCFSFGCGDSSTDSDQAGGVDPNVVDDDDAIDDDDSVDGDDDDDDDIGTDDDDNDDINDDDDNDAIDDDDDDTADCLPPGGGALSPLKAGVAVTDLNIPVGIPLAGFGWRTNPNHPLATWTGASTGWYDRLNVKALALDNGADRLVIVRVPVVFVSDVIYTLVIQRVCEKAGVDLTEKLWIHANHTHSGPARIFPMPAFASFGSVDTWYQPAVDALVDSISGAIIQAMDSLEPAAIAIGLDENFDPNDHVCRDRRCADGPDRYKENRLLVTRIDKVGGDPLAVVLGIGIHCTMSGDSYYTSDVLGVAEYVLQERYDRPVEVFALSTSSGDQSPISHSGRGHHLIARMEINGNLIADKALALMEQLAPSDNFTFEMVSKRVEVSRSILGYQPGEFGVVNALTGNWNDYKYGAMFCGVIDMSDYGSINDCDNPATTLLDGYLGCALNLGIVWGWMGPFKYAYIGAVRLGDHYLMLFPGELAAPLASNAIQDAAVAYGLDESRFHSVGYSNDHQFYLLTYDSWIQGGYEAEMTMWGPRYGPWLKDQIVSLAGQLFTAQTEDNQTNGYPPFMFTNDLFKPVAPEINGFPPDILVQPEPSYRRNDLIRIEWGGGFTGVDFPRAEVKVNNGGAFVDAMDQTGRPVSDNDLTMIVEYHPEPDYDALDYPDGRLHRWMLKWDVMQYLPAGEYRVFISGNWWDGLNEHGYEMTTETFTISPDNRLTVNDLSVQSLGANDFEISCTGWYPTVPGSYRLRHPDYGPSSQWPVSAGAVNATISVQGGSQESCLLEWDETGSRFAGTFTLTQVGLVHSVSIQSGGLADQWGNFNAAPSEAAPFPQ